MRTSARIVLIILIGFYAAFGVLWLVHFRKQPQSKSEYAYIIVQEQLRNPSVMAWPHPVTYRSSYPSNISNYSNILNHSNVSNHSIPNPQVQIYLTSDHQVHSVGGGSAWFPPTAPTHQTISAPLTLSNCQTIQTIQALSNYSTLSNYSNHQFPSISAKPVLRRDGFIDDPDPQLPADPLGNEDGFIDDPDPELPADPLANTPIGAIPIGFIGLLICIYIYKKARRTTASLLI